MLHLARKAFYPSVPPFPLLHVDTTWKFQAMYEFRDQMAAEVGHGAAGPPEPGVRRRRASTRSTTARRCTPTCGRPRGSSRRSTSTGSTWPSAAPAATRRSRGPRSGSSRSARRSTAGTRRRSAPSCGGSTTPARSPGRACGSSRCRTGPSSTCGSTSTSSRSRSCRCTSPAARPVVERDGTLIMVDDDRMPRRARRGAGAAQRAVPHPGLLPAHRRHRERRRRR